MPAAPPEPDVATATRLRMVLGQLSRKLRVTDAASIAGLSPTRISVLLGVDRRGPIRISELAELESLNPTMLSRSISSLVEAGLLARVSDAGDRRAAWVQVSDAGHRLAERMRRERTEVVDRGMADLSSEDRRVLERAIPALEALAARLGDGAQLEDGAR